MTVQQFAQSIIEDPVYRQSIVARAAAGTLPNELELLLWDLASTRAPLSQDREKVGKLVAINRPEGAQ